jgi:hypothetical protein
MHDFEQRVRERAYRMWQEAGCPEGRADEHWDKARELVAIEDNQKITTKPLVNPSAAGPFGEPIEPVETLENAGEFPTLTDQGEQNIPRRRGDPLSEAGNRPKPSRPATRPRTPLSALFRK